MLISQNKYVLNFLISKYLINSLQNLPQINTVVVKIFYNKKTIFLIMTTFYLFFFLSDKKPKILKKTFVNFLFIKLTNVYAHDFLYNFFWLFYKYNNTHISFFNSQSFDCKNVRIFFYTIQNIFFELFFLNYLQKAKWEDIVFKLELLFNFSNKFIKISYLKFLFKSYKLI